VEVEEVEEDWCVRVGFLTWRAGDSDGREGLGNGFVLVLALVHSGRSSGCCCFVRTHVYIYEMRKVKKEK
jgi:hypothetical protein